METTRQANDGRDADERLQGESAALPKTFRTLGQCAGEIARRFVQIAVLAFALAAPLAAQDSSDEVATAPNEQVELTPVAGDQTIADRIGRILDATSWFQNLTITVDEGVVFLSGTTQTEERATWARDLAAKTDGVFAVVNRINVDERVEWSLDPALSELERLAEQAIAVLPLVLLAVLILPLAWFLSKLLSRLALWGLTGRVRSPFLRRVVARAVAFPVFLLGLYVVLQVAGLTQLAISVVGGAGVLGIVIGFAFRDIAENFLASLILSMRRPFQRDDFIEVAGIMGTVKSMNSRSTLITSVEGNEIHVPNATIFKNIIENYSSSPNRREHFDVGIGYDARIVDAQSVILDALNAHPAVLSTPEPMVLVDALGAATVNIRTYFWFDGHQISAIKLKSALLRSVKSALTNHGISMPDEAREVIFPEGVRVIGGDETESKVDALESVKRDDPLVFDEPTVSAGEGDLLSEVPQESGAEDEGDLLEDR